MLLYRLGRDAMITPQQSTIDTTSWGYALASRLGNNTPSQDILSFIDAWIAAENTTAQNNPLATTQPMMGATDFNSKHVKNYLTVDDGLDATVLTLQSNYPGYADIVAGIQTNDVGRAFNGLALSPWGSNATDVASIYNNASARPQSNGVQDETRRNLVAYALSLQGIPYISGGRSASGGDCSGTMQHIYLTIAGIDIGATTFDQLPKLQPIDIRDMQPGDLWYGQFPDDQHTGMVADVNGDGQWDLIHNGADAGYLHVTYSFLTDSYLGAYTIGFRRALP